MTVATKSNDEDGNEIVTYWQEGTESGVVNLQIQQLTLDTISRYW